MPSTYTNRADAPFSDKVWGLIDRAVVEAAKSQLSARRVLNIEGPYGLGLKSVPTADRAVADKSAGEVTVATAETRPLLMLSKSFVLPARDVAAYEASGIPFDLGPAAQAAMQVARQEDQLLLNGSKAAGVEGLANAKGAQKCQLGEWKELGKAMDSLIKAAGMLDAAGFHGPYSLALAPQRFNLLFRRYQQGNQTELEHVRQLVTDGVHKAPALADGGVLIASGPQFATIVLGQDLTTGFIGPNGTDYELLVSETLALRLRDPRAVCVLQ